MSVAERTPSKSPQRRASLISSLSAKIGRVLGDVDENTSTTSSIYDDVSSINTKVEKVEEEGQANASTQKAKKDRSVSRGRDNFHSSGRGGAGNIRRKDSGQSQEPISPRVMTGREVEVHSPIRRGRNTSVDSDKSASQAVGRGGIGNIRSRSRARAASHIPAGNTQLTATILSEAAANNAEYERNVIQNSQESSKILQKSGRGGIGNITTQAKSRSRSRGPNIHSTGRGGVGNLQPGSVYDAENTEFLEEVDRLRINHEDGVHSTGRGGLANMTSLHSPPPEGVPHHGVTYEAMGRGGAGNIIRSRSASRDPEGRSPFRRQAWNC
ncbi:hypothetical protein QCA50_013715 [Cerrena zonata]|uniref:Uncharacterized protein n=1 Tax=Cerrena zonata TaxID=2478898 RepID=A0AAW0FZG1_9APHY